MWPFGRKAPDKARVQGHRRVRVNGFDYTIRRLNPLMDFSASEMPQIFSDYAQRRKVAEKPLAGVEALARAQRDVCAVLQAGIVEPRLVQVGKGDARGREDGLTAEDIMRDSDTAYKLYAEIMAWSLNQCRGIRGFFTLSLLRYRLYTVLLSSTAPGPATSSSAQAEPA